MAKTTRHGGPSFTPEEEAALEYVPKAFDPNRVRRAEVGPMKREQKGEESSPGNNSTVSTNEQPPSKDKPVRNRQEPAPDAENLSSVQDQESANADSTDGNTQGTAKGSNKAPVKATKRTGARATAISEDDDF